MHSKRQLSSLCLALAAVFAAPGANALGWGRAPQSAVLGQSLDFNVSLRLDPGDVVDPKCVAAEVTSGDSRLPSTAVRVGVDTSAPDALQIRVVTGPALEEPVATVTVAVGCPARLSRRFTLLVDPVPTVPTVPPPAAVPLAESMLPRSAPAPAASAPVVTAAPRPVARPDTAASAAAPAPTAAPRPARKPVAAKPAPAPRAAAPRLQLDPIEPVAATSPAMAASAVEDALAAVARAASAAQAAASAASAAEGRVAALERELAQMRAEAERNRELAVALQERAASVDSARRWLWPALIAAALLAALAAWLATRLRAAREQTERAWRAAANATQAAQRPDTPTSQLPMVTSEILGAPSTHPGRPTVPGYVPVAPALATMRPVLAEPPVSPAERTEVQPRPSADESAPRDVSIEELLDLEQQAEFFMVLGQEEAAIDLLVDHLRDTGGGSPLPYLKLLEIYKRRDDREAYERTRARFNHRFNAYAPDWDVDLASGRSLEDYPGVVPRLQQVWGKPLDAMAELEALLFRKSRGQLFDLPAYREVLFLYSLARDLLDREAADSGNVDLLLPLSDAAGGAVGRVHLDLQLEGESVFDPLPEDKPTAPVDLDLSLPDDNPASIVDPLSPKN